jgi:solute carrier family 25 citrate transporter 1
MVEAVFAVTPSETIKLVQSAIVMIFLTGSVRTKLIDDSKRPNPQYRGLLHGTASIVRQEGILGIYRGLFPVVSQIALFAFKALKFSTRVLDDASRSQLCCPFHNLFHFETICARQCPTWTNLA